jgi:hypothetical protein
VGTLVAQTFANAYEQLWLPVKTYLENSPWFVELHALLKDYENRLGEEVFKFQAQGIHYLHRQIMLYPAGPIPSENTLLEFIEQRNKLYVPIKADQLRIKRVFLDSKFEDAIKDDQELFARAIKRVNGCTPEQNAKFYLDAVTDYASHVTLDQAAYECGLSVDDFKLKVRNINSLRVAKMISDKSEPIPRQAWESPGKDGQPGLFQQCMTHINGLTAKITETRVIDKRLTKTFIIVKNDTDVRITNPDTKKEEILGKVRAGEKLELQTLKFQGWVGVIFNGKSGYIEEKNVTRE